MEVRRYAVRSCEGIGDAQPEQVGRGDPHEVGALLRGAPQGGRRSLGTDRGEVALVGDQHQVGGRPAADVVADQEWLEGDFIPTVAKRGAAIIEARGASSAASAANAAIDHVYDWVNGTPEGDWTSAAIPSDGSYGVAEGLISSFPVTSRDGSWQIVQGLDVDDFSRGRIDTSVRELEEEREAVKGLGLV